MIGFRDKDGLLAAVKEKLDGRMSISDLLRWLVKDWLAGKIKLES